MKTFHIEVTKYFYYYYILHNRVRAVHSECLQHSNCVDYKVITSQFQVYYHIHMFCYSATALRFNQANHSGSDVRDNTLTVKLETADA